ncbi:centriole, cilia and spindle-associated protein-like [Pristis pectinata]|uniref:centriole, cilia and spindle-associated protein-like n=1 Tax=Pristis pectinata TaxID=685728 RepID=UPI00223E7D4B|nr:centriole, cilia and spindle-associated protein-like [Pristis pectinata]
MTKRMKTEYMKKFKGPKWDTYGSCYTDLVQYRNMRRILEQAHIPWVWAGWDTSSSSSSGTSTPRIQEQPWGATCPAASLPGAPQEPGAPPRGEAEPPAAERPRAEPPAAERPRAEPPAAERPRAADFHSSEKEIIVEENQKDKSDQQSKREVCDYRRVKSASLEKSHKTSQAAPAVVVTKETKPPFAMYGWAEKEVEVGCKKTYNVGASALRGQVYESAVRAQDRRQVQRAMRMSRTRHRGTEPRSNRAVDHWCKILQGHKPASQHSQVQALKSAGADNPWLSEYMRCFSARSL